MTHKLVNDTLVREADGIVARCVCGWTSGPRFSSMLASLCMQDHREAMKLECPCKRTDKGCYNYSCTEVPPYYYCKFTGEPAYVPNCGGTYDGAFDG